MPRRYIVAEALLLAVLLAATVGRFDSSAVLRNRTALAIVECLASDGISVADIGLHMEYKELPLGLMPRIEPVLAVTCESAHPRLAVQIGIMQLTSGNLDEASKCFSWALAARPGMPDAEILLMSGYHLANRPVDSLRIFEQLPEAVRTIPSVAAQALLDYAVMDSSNTDLVPSSSFHGIVPRAVLFGLLDSDPTVASGFLDEAFSAGLFSLVDYNDFESIMTWSSRSGQVETTGMEETALLERDELMNELRIATASSLRCALENVSVGPDVVMDQSFGNSSSMMLWRNLAWTSGAASVYNKGGFKWGWDMPPEGVNIGAMRISGLWKEEDSQLYPASASVQFDTPVQLEKGKSLYLIYVRYKTEHLRDGQVTIWFDSFDYRRFVGVWQLPPTDGAWRERYALGNVDSDASPVARPMISSSALGTVWIDHLMVAAVHLEDCFVAQGVKVVGELHGTSTR